MKLNFAKRMRLSWPIHVCGLLNTLKKQVGGGNFNRYI